MNENKEKMKVQMDGYTRGCLTIIAVLLTVLIIGLWANHTPLAGHATAKGPFLDNSTQAQLVDLVKAQNKTTAKLDQMLQLLSSGRLRVRISGTVTQPKKAKDVPAKTTP